MLLHWNVAVLFFFSSYLFLSLPSSLLLFFPRSTKTLGKIDTERCESSRERAKRRAFLTFLPRLCSPKFLLSPPTIAPLKPKPMRSKCRSSMKGRHLLSTSGSFFLFFFLKPVSSPFLACKWMVNVSSYERCYKDSWLVYNRINLSSYRDEMLLCMFECRVLWKMRWKR